MAPRAVDRVSIGREHSQALDKIGVAEGQLCPYFDIEVRHVNSDPSDAG